jgi:hypothetical protein
VRTALDAMRSQVEALRTRVSALEGRTFARGQARRRAATEQDDRDAVLGALIAELVGDDVFTAKDLIVRALNYPELRRGLVFAAAWNGRRLGHLLVRLETRRGNGCHFLRIGADRSGLVWRVLRD